MPHIMKLGKPPKQGRTGLTMGEQQLPKFVGVPVISRHLRFVGVISYSLYLLHQPLLETVKPALAG